MFLDRSEIKGSTRRRRGYLQTRCMGLIKKAGKSNFLHSGLWNEYFSLVPRPSKY